VSGGICMARIQLVVVVLACGWIGCGKEGPTDGFIRTDMSDPCRSSFPPARCKTDMALPLDVDMAMQAAAIGVSGDNTSGYTGATLSSFTCVTNNASTGPYVQSPFPNNFAAASPLYGKALVFTIYNDGVWVTDSASATIYYQTAAGAFTANTSGKTGTLPSTTLNSNAPASGKITVAGAWKCP
jgi:hypothetical protein